ncbi:MAG: DUF4184 family protein [Candidatus Odinarchaeota archaeon]|nr:DUF4184 family protein [Candidatus Odinarchaeota archaeon]
MPAWIAHPGILIINRIGKKKRFSGSALVWGSLTPDLEFIPYMIWAIVFEGDSLSILTRPMQGIFHSIIGLLITVPLAVVITYIMAKPTKKILESRLFSFLKIRNLNEKDCTLTCHSLSNCFISASIGVLSAIFFDAISHDSITMFAPFYPPIRNPLLAFGIVSLHVWLALSVILFVLFLVGLYKYPCGTNRQ